jgi:uncharacterized NAD(P)/FAD-binding protein YdhS
LGIWTVTGRCPVIAIIGGGFSGTLTAVHLLRHAAPGTRILLIERSGDVGPGVAYATHDVRHLLNVPAARMSAVAGEPDDLVRWADVAPDAYIPRRVYGEYLRARLASAAARSDARLERMTGEVVRLRPARAAIELVLGDGGRVACDRAVLALGNLPGAPPCDLPDDPRIVRDAWRPGALEEGGSASTVIVGSGPTAVDVALSVCGDDPRARVVMVSRHGRLPFAHLPGLRDAAPPPPLPGGALRLRSLERHVRAHVGWAEHAGYDWRDVLDGLRPLVPELWGRLSVTDRATFLRERARSWEIRRHRLAPAVGAEVNALLTYGRLSVLAGGVEAVRPRARGVAVCLGGGRTVIAARVITCTGAGTDVTATPDPLVRRLLADGHASADALGLGLRATPAGALLDAAGRSDERVWLLGPLRRGELWESTAVRELRDQAETVATGLCASLAQRPAAPIATMAG